MTGWVHAAILGVSIGAAVGVAVVLVQAAYTFWFPKRRNSSVGYVVARIEEIDDTEGPQLVGFSSDVYPTTASASDAHAFAESWRPGWHTYQLIELTEEKNC